MEKPTRISVWFFTDDQRKRLSPIWDNDKNFLIFNREIAPAMTQACRPKVTRGQKRKLQKKAAKSADKFIDDFKKCELFWELWHSEEGEKEIEALGSIRRKLDHISDELHKRDKRSSKHYELAAAVGIAMVKSGLKVSSYEDGKVVDVIEICMEAAGLPEYKDFKKLADIAWKAANSPRN